MVQMGFFKGTMISITEKLGYLFTFQKNDFICQIIFNDSFEYSFVTLDPETKKPVKMPSLIPQSNEERVLFELGALKARNKKMSRRAKRFRAGEQLTEGNLQIDKIAAALLEEAGPLLNMPSLADSNSILMSRTEMQNALMAQPQVWFQCIILISKICQVLTLRKIFFPLKVRNMSDRIFGGYLMRRGFELAYATAYLFGGEKPNFIEVDDISFESPVDVGDLLVFKSRVLYTIPDGGDLGEYVQNHQGMPLIMIEVEALVTEPEKVGAKVCNHFYFTFALPNKTNCRRVLPGNLEEARRMATRMVADDEQTSLRS